MTDSFQQAVDAAGESLRRKPRRSISDEARERMKVRSITCGQCGQVGTRIVDGSECGGLSGVKYKVCNGCGWTRAMVKKQRKFKL